MTGVILAQVDAGLEGACGPDPGFFCEFIYDQSGSEALAEFFDEVAVRPLKVIVILAVAWVIARIARRLINGAVERLIAARTEQTRAETEETEASAGDRRSLQERAIARARRLAEASERSKQRTETLGAVLRSLATIVIYSIAAIMALGEFDVNLGPLIASAGIVGIALGFGAQSLVKDFLSGIFMLVEDQYGVGDIVDVGDAAGVVEQVNLRTTQVRDVNGTLWHVPNGEIRRVGNKSQEWARAVLDVEVAYNTDIEHATRVIKEVADGLWNEEIEHATILEEPQIWGVENFAESSIWIRLAMKVEPAEQFAVQRLVRRRLKEAFDREGIEIPFPQRTLWIKREADAEPLRPKATEAAAAPGDDSPTTAPPSEYT